MNGPEIRTLNQDLSRIVASGLLTTSSATVPADSARAEANDYFNGCWLIPVMGAVAYEPRRIVDYTAAGGIFIIDTSNPFTAATGMVNYIVVADPGTQIPAADSALNFRSEDVIGNKQDTALQAATAADSLMRYIKGLLIALGDPTGHTLASFTAKWGDIARSLDLILGARWDGAGDLGTDIAALIAAEAVITASQGRQLFTMDFWSAGLEEVQIAAAAGTDALPDITVADLPAGATVVKATVMFKFRMIENTYAGVNKLNGATVATTSQVIQIRSDAPTAYVDAINFVDDYFTLADSAREGGDVIIGTIDVSATVDENDTYNLQWLLARADQDFINFNDVQVGLRVWYSV